MDSFPPRRRRQPATLNLIAIMNIFAVLIIFFVKANVVGETAVEIPEEIRIPKSISSETVDTAPEVYLYGDTVHFKLIKLKASIEDVRGTGQGPLSDRGDYLMRELKSYIDTLSDEAKEFGLIVNLVAGSDVPYRHVYDVVHFLKLSGFQYALFIAEVADSE